MTGIKCKCKSCINTDQCTGKHLLINLRILFQLMEVGVIMMIGQSAQFPVVEVFSPELGPVITLNQLMEEQTAREMPKKRDLVTPTLVQVKSLMC